ncbi:uncharacterized protein LTR77_009920 [Saxophila tyrrhenica]|uniref:Uncharacterized protein n=1 Tax=Saxophila tyrrhenica TaxID=1690608 RepID=A0AAV9NWC3_9PEZI|nr:hypothetical protein LTR77_009920 [Saxophila tyrrhenica]
MADLFSLPAELRDHIYALVLATRTSNFIAPHRDLRSCVQPAHTRVNHQLRSETIPVPFRLHEIRIGGRITDHEVFGSDGSAPTAFDWIQRLGVFNLQHVRDFTITVGPYSSGMQVRVQQTRKGRTLELVSFRVGDEVGEWRSDFNDGPEEDRLCKQVEGALGYLASDTDLQGQEKLPGLASSPRLLRNLFVYLLRVATRIKEDYDRRVAEQRAAVKNQTEWQPRVPKTALSNDGFGFLFADNRITDHQKRLAVEYNLLHPRG